MTLSLEEREKDCGSLLAEKGDNSDSSPRGRGFVRRSPPDGGWGWVVVGAGFLVTMLVDGIVGSFGLLYPDVLSHFGASPTLTAMTGSIQVGVYPTVGVLAAWLIHRCGCRPVAFLGGLLSTFGLAVSVASPSIAVFIVTFGVITGLGFGFAYLPSLVTVSLYFDRRRGLALGIVSAGSGLGVLALAPLSQAMIEAFAWRGAVLLLGGVALHMCLAAVLMTSPRPFSSSQASRTPSSDSLGEEELTVLVSQLDNSDKHGDHLALVQTSRLHVPSADWPTEGHVTDDCSRWFSWVPSRPACVDEGSYGEHRDRLVLDSSSADCLHPAVFSSQAGRDGSPGVELPPGGSRARSRSLCQGERGSDWMDSRGGDVAKSQGSLSPAKLVQPDRREGTPSRPTCTPCLPGRTPEAFRLGLQAAAQTEWEDRPGAQAERREDQNALSGQEHQRHAVKSPSHRDSDRSIKSDQERAEKQNRATHNGFLSRGLNGEHHGGRSELTSLGGGYSWRSCQALPPARPDSFPWGGARGGVFHSMEGLSCPRHSASVRQHALAQGDHPHFRPHPHPHLHPHPHPHLHPRHHCQHPGPSKQAILLSSSMLSLSQFKSQSAIGDHMSEVAPPGGQGETSEASSDSGLAGRGGMWLLVLDPAFLALCLASALIQLACMVPLFFVADFAASLQMDRDRAALLIGVYGVCNMVGRAGAGGLATLRQVNVLALQFLGLALAGTACLLLPLCTSFPPLLAAFSVLFGVSIGFFPPLQPLLLVEYFSLEQLTSSLGLLSMVKGIATIVGPPIAGGLFEASKDYNHSFLAAGGALYLSAGVHLLMPLARRLQGRARSPATSDSGQPASSPCACSSSDSGHPASSPCTSSHSDST